MRVPFASRRFVRFLRPSVARLLALGWALGVSVLLFDRLTARGYDDPYITFRYAQNVAQGVGYVYNGGEQVQSTTTPFFTLLLAAAARLGCDIPLVATAIGCASLGAGALALWGMARNWRSPIAAWAILLLYPLAPLLLLTLGAESTFYNALLYGGMLACMQGRLRLMAVLLALATLTRADAAVAVVACGVFLVGVRIQDSGLRRSDSAVHPRSEALLPLRERAWGEGQFIQALLIYALLVGPWFLFAWWYFGTPFPVTLAAKQAQGALPESRSFLEGLILELQRYAARPYYWLTLALAALGVGASLHSRDRRCLLFGWALAYAVAYAALGVSGYFWYYAPLVGPFIVAAALGAQHVAHFFPTRAALPHSDDRAASPHLQRQYPTFLLVAVMLGAQLYGALTLPRDYRLDLYRETGRWLRTHSPADARVGALEVGIIGYHSQRTVIDFAGLLQPAVATQIAQGANYDAVARWATLHYRPDYLVLVAGSLPSLTSDPQIASACRPQVRLATVDYPDPMLIFFCNW
jgi:hypothetical protein